MRRVVVVAGATYWLALSSAFADTQATCTTDTATSYCEQPPSGVGSSSFLSGFGIAELASATLFAFLISFVMVRRLLRAAGL